MLYLDQYQDGLLEAEVAALREQARIYAGALGESAVRVTDPNNPVLVPDIARPLLRRLTDPTPNAGAKIYAPDGTLIADSRVRMGAGGAVTTEPLPADARARPGHRRWSAGSMTSAGPAAACQRHPGGAGTGGGGPGLAARCAPRNCA